MPKNLLGYKYLGIRADRASFFFFFLLTFFILNFFYTSKNKRQAQERIHGKMTT